MKLIVRVDDVGYTNVHNLGTYKTIEEGIATAADVMLDTPGTIDALQRLRNYPWISVGWHSHFWGSPVLPASEVPTLIAPNGHFRDDVAQAADVSYDEALKELRAQLFMCVDILGRAPGYREFGYSDDTPFGKAMAVVTKEFSIATNYMKSNMTFSFPADMKIPDDFKMPEMLKGEEPKKMPAMFGSEVDPRWVDRKIFYGINGGMPTSDSVGDSMSFDPADDFLKSAHTMLEQPSDRTFFSAWHPGYVDYYVLRQGDHGPAAKNFILCRPIDVEALCDQRMKNWIIDNKVELVNFRDALYGTREYQDHLRLIGSPLAVD